MKILILGATGAMATYLVPELLSRGYEITGVALDELKTTHKNLKFIKTDAKDISFLNEELKNKYDAVVDFMIYPSKDDFKNYYKLFLENTKHYIFLSTYRVYANDYPITETSLRILNDNRPSDFVTEGEYCIYKAEEEDILRKSGYNNYTIIRPAITYSKRRFQLTVLEANVLIYRMIKGKTVVLPLSAMEHQATMSWAGDVAKMIAELILNEKAYGEAYTVSTSEHNTWREVAEMYKRIGNLDYITVDDDTFLDIISDKNSRIYVKQQLLYDRCYERIINNSKILEITGIKQSELMPLEKGLKKEFENVTLEMVGYNEQVNRKMDLYLQNN